MKQVIQQQQQFSLVNSEKNLSSDRATKLSQSVADETNKKLDKIHDVLETGLTGQANDTLNSNVVKLFGEVKNQTKALSKLVAVSAEQGKSILDKSRGTREFKSIGQRFQGAKESVKDFFTGRGFLDKTGIVKRGTGGMVSEYLDAKEDTKKYAKARIAAGDPTVKLHGVDKSTKIFERQRTEQQQLRREQGDDERKIESYKKQGISEKQIAKSPEAKRLQETAIKLAKVDPALRPEGFDVASGMIKQTVEKVSKEDAKEKEDTKGSSKLKPSTSQEIMVEAQRSRDAQTELLTKIEENTAGAGGVDAGKVKPKEEAGGAAGGLLGTIMGFLGDGLMMALKAMFNPKNILKFLGKIALPAMIIGSLVNGIMDGFNTFMETGSISEALIAGLGGVLSFLSFGLFDAETIRSITDAVSGLINDYIIDPIKNFFGFLGESFSKYISQPIMDAFSYVGGLFGEYIIDPLKKIFAPITSFFSKIKDQLLSFVEDFGIPEISFTIPIINKKVAIGPFYPFRPEAGGERVRTTSDTQLGNTGGAGGETAKASTVFGFSGTESDKTTAASTSTKASMIGGKAVSESRALSAEFDTKTGKAAYTSESTAAGAEQIYGKEISKSTFGKVKRMSARGEDTAAIETVIKEDAAYDKLGFFDKRKVDVGYAKATDLLALQKPETKTGEIITTKSAANAGAAMTTPPQAPIIVSAPTTNNTSKQNIALPTPIRNDDSGFNRYMNRRAAII